MSVEFPASFMFIAAMNPCPCGYYNHPDKKCSCQPGQIRHYMSKISGPLLDRIDLHVEIIPVPFSELSQKKQGESSAVVRERVIRARQIQLQRFQQEKGIYTNAQMSPKYISKYCQLDENGQQLLKMAMEKLGLSARAYHRILKVSRTIADMDGAENISMEHLSEAIHFRSLDRDAWGR